jgi:hypothetical protein
MPTPEQQRQYSKLSGELQELSHSFLPSLPDGTASLHLHSNGGQVQLDAYDATGKIIRKLQSDQIPEPFREAIQRLGREDCPDADGIICPV